MIELLAILGAAALGRGVVSTWQRFKRVNKVYVYSVEGAYAEFFSSLREVRGER